MATRCFIALTLMLTLWTQGQHAIGAGRVLDQEGPVSEQIVDGPFLVTIQGMGKASNRVVVTLRISAELEGRGGASTMLFFNGECAQTGSITVMIRNQRTPEFIKFQDNPSIDTFPALEALATFRKALSNQCPTMQEMKVSTSLGGITGKLFEGSLTMVGGWKLRSGSAEDSALPQVVKRVLDEERPASERIVDGEFVISIEGNGRQRNGLYMLLMKEARVRGELQAVMTLMFQGSCGRIGEIIVSTSETASPAYAAFQARPTASDIPFPSALQSMQSALAYQCPAMQTMIVSFGYQSNATDVKTYRGTLAAANSWQLTDGVADDEQPVYVRFRSHQQNVARQRINYNIGAEHRGFCEDRTEIGLSTFPSPNNYNGAPDLADYEWTAGQVTRLYLDTCPNVEQINFRLLDRTHDYNCQNGCLVRTTRAEKWAFSSKQSDLSEIVRARNLPDVLAYLKVANYAAIPKDHLFGVFYYRYLSHYSARCKAQIKDPVAFEMVIETKAYDGYGFEQSSITERLPTKVYVERKYSDKFSQYFRSNHAQGMLDIFNAIAVGKQRQAVPSPEELLERITRGDREIETHLDQGCDFPDVMTVYANLYEHAH